MSNRYQGNVRFVATMIGGFLLLLFVAVAINPTGFPTINWPPKKQPNSAVFSAPQQVTPVPTAMSADYRLTKDQFPNGHHVLVCSPCNFGIWNELTESFQMGMEMTSLPYNENLSVYPHVKEGELQVNQSYVIATISTYTIYVNGEVLDGMFEGIFNGKDSNGYYQFTVVNSAATSPLLTPGQVVTTPYLHGGFLNPNSK